MVLVCKRLIEMSIVDFGMFIVALVGLVFSLSIF